MQTLHSQTLFKAVLPLEVFTPQGKTSLVFSENREGFFPAKDFFLFLLELTGVDSLMPPALLASRSQVLSRQTVSSFITVQSRFSLLFSASASFVTSEDTESSCNDSLPENILRFFVVEDFGEKKDRMSCCLSFSN